MTDFTADYDFLKAKLASALTSLELAEDRLTVMGEKEPELDFYSGRDNVEEGARKVGYALATVLEWEREDKEQGEKGE